MEHIQLEFSDVNQSTTIAKLTINRPNKANSFAAQTILELTEAFQSVAENIQTRLLIIQGAGKHFSAGADLEWMRASRELSSLENQQDALALLKMFQSLKQLLIPVVAVAKGSTMGGGLGILACADYVLAQPTAQFCLSEIKLGLIPAIIYPFLEKKCLNPHKLKWLALTGQKFDCEQGQALGLIDQILPPDKNQQQEELNKVLNQALNAAPEAQASLKNLTTQLERPDTNVSQLTVSSICNIRVRREAQYALEEYLNKRPIEWQPANQKLDMELL